MFFRIMAASELGSGETDNLKISDVEDFITAAECSVDGFRSKTSLREFFIIRFHVIPNYTYDNVRKFPCSFRFDKYVILHVATNMLRENYSPLVIFCTFNRCRNILYPLYKVC